MSAPETAAARRAGAREWVSLVALALPALLLSIDMSALYLALPTLSRELGASATDQLWIVDIYSFLLAGFLVSFGALADRVGRRKVMLVGAALFGIASAFAAFSTSPEMLIAARAAMGIAGATLMPTTLATLRVVFAETGQLGAAIGIWFGCFMIGMFAGPVMGGLLIGAFGWGSVFLMGIPVMLVLLVLGPILLPESNDAQAGWIDLPSVALSILALLPLAWAVKEVARAGWSPLAVGALVVGLAAGVVFLLRQRTLRNPLVDLGLFRIRRFSGALALTAFGGVIMAGASLASAIFMQSVAQLSPLEAGLLLLPQNVAMLIGFGVAPQLAKRLPAGPTMALGLLVGAVGFGLLLLVSPGEFLPLVVGMSLASFGVAFPMALGTEVIMTATPEERAGSAAAISETSGELGVGVGIAALGSVATFAFRADLLASGAEASPEALSGLDHALAEAERIGGSAGDALAAAAREAFTAAVHVVGVSAAAGFAILAAVAFATIRSRRSEPSAPAEEPVATS